jgi:hypothetical protein
MVVLVPLIVTELTLYEALVVFALPSKYNQAFAEP